MAKCYWSEWKYKGSMSDNHSNVLETEVVNIESGLIVLHDHESKTAMQYMGNGDAEEAVYQEYSKYIEYSAEYENQDDDDTEYGFIRNNNFNEY